jgi:formate-dependent nitrite reductase membrane component NrfD
VIVCPEQAIIAGDLDDPGSRIARLVATEQVQVRKAEQGTRPKVFYLGADAAALDPTLQTSTERYLWAQRPSEEVDLVRMVAAANGGATRADASLSRPVYDVPHQTRPWGWKVAAYLWTKSIAAGALLLAGASALLDPASAGPISLIAAPVLALLFLTLTAGLLVFDLKRPDRFHYILLKPNTRSWLVIGGYIMLGFGTVAGLWLLAGLAGSAGLVRALALPGVLLAMALAGYSAFLFGQAEGRDFWQSPLLLPHLLVAAVVTGASALALVSLASEGPAAFLVGTLRLALVWGLVAHGGLLVAELSGSHANVPAARAARLFVAGHWRPRFWGGVVLAGIVAPIVLAWLGAVGLGLGAILALAGLWLYEDLWVKAGQSIPLS